MGIKGEILLRDNQYSWETLTKENLIFLWFIVTDIEQNSHISIESIMTDTTRLCIIYIHSLRRQ